MSLVQLFKAAYRRLLGNDARAVIAALLDKPLDDILVMALSIIFRIAAQKPGIAANDALDLAIAQAADQEGTNDDIDPQLQKLADYLAPNVAGLPQPIPRVLLQPLADALVKEGTQPSRAKAVQFLLNTYPFA